MINYDKPLETNCDRKVQLIAKTDDGGAIVHIPSGYSKWHQFDREGKFVKSETGSGSSLTLNNSVKKDTVYLRLSTFADKDQTSVSREPPTGYGVASIRVDLEDGVVVAASLNRSNIKPINNIYNINASQKEEL